MCVIYVYASIILRFSLISDKEKPFCGFKLLKIRGQREKIAFVLNRNFLFYGCELKIFTFYLL